MLQQGYVSLQVTDGTGMNAYTALPEQGSSPFPAIIVLQEAFGINHHIRDITDRLAQQGYIAIAPELFHRTGPGFEGSYDNFPGVMPHIQALTVEGLEADVKAAFNWLLQQANVRKDKIGSIGFCMGGRVSFMANMILPLSAAVSYYAGNTPSIINRLHEIHAPQLMFWGGLDKHITKEQVEIVVKTLKDAGKQFINVEISYADHGFNCDERASYHPKAAKEAWAMALAFLENNLKG